MTDDEVAAHERSLAEQQKKKEKLFTALQRARKAVEEATATFQNAAFDAWVRGCLDDAETPSDWTQARTLYDNYLKHAAAFGRNRAQKGLAQQVLATETTWGRMMSAHFPKTRRTNGMYYPLRIKRGG